MYINSLSFCCLFYTWVFNELRHKTITNTGTIKNLFATNSTILNEFFKSHFTTQTGILWEPFKSTTSTILNQCEEGFVSFLADQNIFVTLTLSLL